MRKSIFVLSLAAIFLIFGGAGCDPLNFFNVGGANNPASKTDGGIFKSVDKGETWVNLSQLLTTGARRDFRPAGIAGFAIDPSDHLALYAGSVDNGLFYSYSGSAGWEQPDQIKGGTVKAVAVDPKNKCTVYIVIGNMIYQSNDCNRTYGAIYQEARPEVAVTGLVIDSFNSSIVYAGNTAGDVFKSTDRGRSWVVIKRFENPIAKIIVNPTDTRVIYAATQDRGIYRSADGGLNWKDLSDGLKQFGGAFIFRDLALFDEKNEGLLLASQYGLIRSGNGGQTWQALNLLTPPNGADIRTLAVNPQNSKEIYYSTPSTLYKTADGGLKWVTKKLPSTRTPTILKLDPADPKTLYLTFEPLKN